MDEKDLLRASTRFGVKFNVYPQYSWIEDHITLLKNFSTSASTKIKA